MSKRLAVVISGAVSLGSYEAGVMYELLEAIARHNESLEPGHPDRVVIDVITGASAGGMTAAILSQQLYHGGQSLRKAYENPLFKAWVEEVDIRKLLKVEPRDHQYSLLSSDVVKQIGKYYLRDNPGTSLDPHPLASDSLQIGLAMSNLNGFSQRVPGKMDFAYSRYKDQFICQLHCNRPQNAEEGGTAQSAQKESPRIHLSEMEPRWVGQEVVWHPIPDTAPAPEITWSTLREMALSSGAFPFAFRPYAIPRSGGSRDSLMRSRDSARKEEAGDKLLGGKYLYTDGGVFENEPVGMAADLAKEIDKNSMNSERTYLFIAPGKRTIDKDPFLNREDNLLNMAVGLAGAIFGQSRFQQWVTEGLEGHLLGVTASDADLIGDVFSAFGGFLEYKFRLYDYNIGRLMARKRLREGQFANLIGDFHRLEKDFPRIDVPTQQSADSPPAPLAAADNDDAIETAAWKALHAELHGLATPCLVEKDGRRERDPLLELRKLMAKVDAETRNEIATQVLARVDSLVDFFNEAYLERLDQKIKIGPVLRLVRNLIGKPLAKLVLRRFVVQPFLNENVRLRRVSESDQLNCAAMNTPS